MIAGIVLAAGASTRFGAPKQIAELDGIPLLEHALGAMEAVPAIERIVVVLGAHADEISETVDMGIAETVLCEDWEEGQAASLRAGVDELATVAESVIVTLADQPRITPQVIARFADLGDRHNRFARARATYSGEPGHPVLLGSAYFPLVDELTGDVGARDLLVQIQAYDIECGALCSAADVDTPEELEAMRT